MRTAHAFEILTFALPLAFFGCSSDSKREAESPSNMVTYESPEPAPISESESMTPASRIEESPGTISDPEPSPGAAPAPETAVMPLTDEQIAAVVEAAHSAEIDASKYALTKTKNARVRKFAQTMIDHHGKAKQAQAKLMSKIGMTPAESTKLTQFKTSASDTERTLKSAPAEVFDKVYIELQVADHQMVLDALDRDFIPSVQNAELKTSLQDFRPKVEAHLGEALEIQRLLTSVPARESGSMKSGEQRD